MTHAREVVTVALATALLAAALYFGPTTNIWLLTGIAGLLSWVAAPGSWWAASSKAR